MMVLWLTWMRQLKVNNDGALVHMDEAIKALLTSCPNIKAHLDEMQIRKLLSLEYHITWLAKEDIEEFKLSEDDREDKVDKKTRM
jgi:hypothetical protein